MQQTKDQTELAFPTELIAVILLAAAYPFALFVLSRRYLVDPDTYWHIETGRWIWTKLEFPRSDIFSHTAFGMPWTNMEWLSQIIFYFSYALLGWHGTVILTALAVTLTVVMMYVLLTRRLRATVALGVTAVALAFASIHYLARPHMLSFPVLIFWVAALAKSCDENRSPSILLLPLMTLWANLHGAFTFGLLLTAGFGFEAVFSAAVADRWRIAIRWLAFLLGATLASCFTPYGYQYLVETYNVLNLGVVLATNSEWRPLNADSEYFQEAVLLILLILALTCGVKIGLPRVLLIVGVLHFALKHVRGLPMLALVWPFMLAGPLQAQFPFLRSTRDSWPLFSGPRSRPILGVACVTIAFIVMIVASVVYVRVQPAVGPDSAVSPRAAVDYVFRQNISGPVLNDFDFGGYLISRGIKTFIDGRTLPFGREFAVAYFDAMAPKNLARLEAMADDFQVSWTLLRSGTVAALYFDHSPRWQRVYADDIAVVHVRKR
jgi:hypothetical protein